MVLKIRCAYILIFVVIFSISCKRTNDSNFKRVVPDSTNKQVYNYFMISRTFSPLLETKKIIDGVDSIEVRLWVCSFLYHPYHLIVFKYDGGKWQGKYYTYTYNQTRNFWDYTFNFIKDINPKSGWNLFVKGLNTEGLFKLKQDYSVVNNAIVGMDDGTLVSIEISTKENYKFFTLPFTNKDYKNDKISADKIINITHFVIDEFNLDSVFIPCFHP